MTTLGEQQQKYLPHAMTPKRRRRRAGEYCSRSASYHIVKLTVDVHNSSIRHGTTGRHCIFHLRRVVEFEDQFIREGQRQWLNVLAVCVGRFRRVESIAGCQNGFDPRRLDDNDTVNREAWPGHRQERFSPGQETCLVGLDVPRQASDLEAFLVKRNSNDPYF